MKPLVTIITPSYNREKYIKKCIDSVLNQTFGEWEMIIVDDKSKDSTVKIVKQYQKNDSRIKLIKHPKNLGIKKLAKTYNQALKVSRGKYVAILEGDDFWPKDKLEKQLKAVVYGKSKAVLSYGDCIITDSIGMPIKMHTYQNNPKLLNNLPTGSIFKLFVKLTFSIIPVTVMINRQALLSIGGFQSDRDYPFTDIPTFLKLAVRGKFVYQNEVLGYYRKQQNSEWFNFASASSAMGREEVSKCINNITTKSKVSDYVSKICKNSMFIENQSTFIQKKKRFKKLSLFLNQIAFKIHPNPFTIIFLIEYLIYKIKKTL